jgi:pimeloyl-ACP methyl ester carboxylesterase
MISLDGEADTTGYDGGISMSESALPHIRLGSGSPLVVMPGLSGRDGSPVRLTQWMRRKEITHLSGHRAVWSIDRRAGLEAGTSIANLAADYAATIRSLFDAPVDIVGVSTGGSIALQLAVDHPGLIRRLVLVSSAHRLSDHGRNTQRSIAALLRERRPRRAAALFLATTASTRIGGLLLTLAGWLAPRAVVGRDDVDLVVTLDAEDSFDLGARLDTITIPTLIAGGAHDRFYSRALFEHISTRMPNARLALYPQAGHIGIQGNRRLVREILQFLTTP